MKRFFITLAVAMMIVPTVFAQSGDSGKALKALAKAKEAIAKKQDAATWI